MCREGVKRAGILAAIVAAAAFGAMASDAAELPTQARKAKPPQSAQAVKKCNIGGFPGVLAGGGVCVRMSGSVSAEVGAGQVK